MRYAAALLAVVSGLEAHPAWGLAVDASGRLYYADVVKNEVYRVDTDGKRHTLARGIHSHDLRLLPDGTLAGEHLWYEPAQAKFFSYAFHIAPDGRFTRLETTGVPVHHDATGNRYGTEPDRVWRLTPDGTRQTLGGVPFAGEKRGKLARLNGLAFANDGAVFVADIEYGCVRRVASTGQVSVAHRSAATWEPWGVAWHQGNLYVLEHRGLSALPSTGTRILRLGRDGKTLVVHEAR